jgi:hypothetical protein
VITEAQGQKEAAITLAEGNRQAAILGAEGERQSAILRAEGLATGLETISTVGEDLDPNTMQLQYLEILKNVGSSPSTKIVVPMELSGLIGGLQSLLPAASNDSSAPADAGSSAKAASRERPARPPQLDSGTEQPSSNGRRTR